MSTLTTGQVAKAAGVNIQTIRFYEREGILAAPRRSRAGYRQYTEDTVRLLSFIKRSQELGFTLKEAKELLKFRSVGLQKREAVRAAAESKVRDIDTRIEDLTRIRAALAALVSTCACQGMKPECPILEALENKSKKSP